MQKINFNSPSFKKKGFEIGEDILIDTGVLLAYLNYYDSWHKTVDELFESYIFDNDDNTLFLYINPMIINEVTHLLEKPAIQYEEKHGTIISDTDKVNMIVNVIDNLRNSIEDEVFTVLEGNKASVLKQLEIFNILGSGDAVNASIANEYGTSFLTVDNRLVNNMVSIQGKLTDIHNVYYTYPTYQS